MSFNPGQKVVFLHESGEGIVASVTEKGRIIIIDEDGFEREYLKSQLAIVHQENYPVDEDIAVNIEIQDRGLSSTSSPTSLALR